MKVCLEERLDLSTMVGASRDALKASEVTKRAVTMPTTTPMLVNLLAWSQRRVCIGVDVPVCVGCKKSICERVVPAAYIHRPKQVDDQQSLFATWCGKRLRECCLQSTHRRNESNNLCSSTVSKEECNRCNPYIILAPNTTVVQKTRHEHLT